MPISAQSFAAAVAHVGAACASLRRGPGSRPRQSDHGDQSTPTMTIPPRRRRRRGRGCRSRLACVRHERTYSATSPSLPIRQPRRRTSGPVFRLGPPTVRPEARARRRTSEPRPETSPGLGPGTHPRSICARSPPPLPVAIQKAATHQKRRALRRGTGLDGKKGLPCFKLPEEVPKVRPAAGSAARAWTPAGPEPGSSLPVSA